jgi:succinate dehydrogenase / fumarate reductase flavoprotein subunit
LIDWGNQIKASDERMIFTSGLGIMDALVRRARALGVDLVDDTAVLDLLVRDGRVCGALGLEVHSGDFVLYQARSVVLATGGWHKAFWPNTGMRDLAGEGQAMAWRAGASLGNLEFITFCCNVFYDPPIWRGSLAPYLITLMLGGRMTNSLGEEFLNQYDPYVVKTGTLTEWNKSFLSYASMKEIRAGRGLPNGGVAYSRGEAPWENVELIASLVFPKWKYKAIDLSEWGRRLKDNQPSEVGPAVEYFEGGIVVDEGFQTDVPGLFAAGECTLGAFGANRVFSAITEMLVHGADAGDRAGDYARSASPLDPDRGQAESLARQARTVLERRDGLRPAPIRRRVQEAAHRMLGPIRNREELRSFLELLEGVKTNELPALAPASPAPTYNKDWLDALELPNLVLLLELAARSALARTESRGVHHREDHPETDNDQWLKESNVRKTDNGFELTHRPVVVTSMTPPAGKVPYLDFIKRMMESRSDTGGKH